MFTLLDPADDADLDSDKRSEPCRTSATASLISFSSLDESTVPMDKFEPLEVALAHFSALQHLIVDDGDKENSEDFEINEQM